MKISVKTLQQKTHQFEVEAEEKISSLKEKIAKLLNHPVDQQKLIFTGTRLYMQSFMRVIHVWKGKILDNEKNIGDYGVKEGDFFVLMVTKAVQKTTTPAAPVASSSASASAGGSTKPQTDKPAAKTTTSAPAPAQTAPAQTTTPAETAPVDPNALVSGAQFEQTVQNLMEMGFERPQILQAMRAAYNNPDRAVEYLMNGIPQAALDDMAGGGAAATAGVASGAASETVSPGGADASGLANALGSNAQLAQLRQLIRQQPHLLEPLLQQLGQTNPQLMQLIGMNPEGFMNWLEGGGAGGLEGEEDLAGMMAEGGMEGDETAEAGGGVGEGGQVIRLTQEEMDAVDRLAALGFDKNQALEAYLACDKNEEMAANYLFDSM